MGFRDRDYYRESDYDDGGYSYRAPGAPRSIATWMITTWMIGINVAVFLVNALFFDGNDLLCKWMSLYDFSLFHPELYWQFLTYGFAHDPGGIWHIGGNMLALLFLGYDVERRLGRWEYLRYYLIAVLFSGLTYSLIDFALVHERFQLFGASGAISAIVILYAIFFPHRTLLLYFVIPIPAWMLGVLFVVSDALGATGYSAGGIAYVAHLGGAAFACLYYCLGWNFGLFFGRIFLPCTRLGKLIFAARGPKIALYRPEDAKSDHPSDNPGEDAELSAQVDRILEKISKSGEASLTRQERALLQKASKKFRAKYPR